MSRRGQNDLDWFAFITSASPALNIKNKLQTTKNIFSPDDSKTSPVILVSLFLSLSALSVHLEDTIEAVETEVASFSTNVWKK